MKPLAAFILVLTATTAHADGWYTIENASRNNVFGFLDVYISLTPPGDRTGTGYLECFALVDGKAVDRTFDRVYVADGSRAKITFTRAPEDTDTLDCNLQY